MRGSLVEAKYVEYSILREIHIPIVKRVEINQYDYEVFYITVNLNDE